MESPKEVIIVENVYKSYKLFTNKRNKLVELVFRRNQLSVMHALRDISFCVEKGESLGLLGLNGSGKSTLANLIAGITTPSSGQMKVYGESSSVSVSVGLNPNLTGIENIEYKGVLLGFTYEKIKELMPKIIEFAEIGDYINQPVKYYSSGMTARLGFAISININPDILVIDEGLSVGDPSFTDKCLAAMNTYREQGKTIVFVSHSLPVIESFCTKALWLEYGHMRMNGEVKEVCTAYKNFLATYNKMSASEKEAYKRSQQQGLLPLM